MMGRSWIRAFYEMALTMAGTTLWLLLVTGSRAADALVPPFLLRLPFLPSLTLPFLLSPGR